jgi:hypothetical protein
LGGLLLKGVYNSRRLQIFEPREGTKLATEELTHMEVLEGDEVEQGGATINVDRTDGQMVP